jgi:hypothetical protein
MSLVLEHQYELLGWMDGPLTSRPHTHYAFDLDGLLFCEAH